MSQAVGGEFVQTRNHTEDQTLNQKSKHKILHEVPQHEVSKHEAPQQKKSPDLITKETIFYYIYGLLHSKDYQERYKCNLDKDLPRIPLVPEFWQFSKIGRKLANLHLNYENQKPPEQITILKNGKEIDISNSLFQKPFVLPEGLTAQDLKVKKMKINKDKTSITFNDQITISNIPKSVWDYKINNWSAVKWIVERYRYKQDKNTDLVNDPNTYSDDPTYILKLLLSIITVSLQTQDLIKSLPSIDFETLTSSMDQAG